MTKIHLHRRKGESRYWQALVYLHNRRFRFSCRTADKPTARRYAQSRVAKLEERFNRGLVGLPATVRMSAVFDRYQQEYAPKLRPSSRGRMLDVVHQARRWFVEGPLHNPEVQSISPGDVQAFLDLKHAKGVTGRTVNLYRTNLHRVFQLCVRPWLLIAANPVDGTETLRHDPREPVLLTEGEYARLRAACNGQPMLSLFVSLAWETGARSGELFQLEWSDIDFERRLVTFVNDPTRDRQTKGRRSRIVPLSESAVTALWEHAADFKLSAPVSQYVFKHLRSARSVRPGDRIETLYKSFKRAAEAAGLPKLRPHDLRHCLVTRKLAEGIPVQLVSKYVGHADLATTLRYSHLIPEHLRAVVEPAKGEVSRSA